MDIENSQGTEPMEDSRLASDSDTSETEETAQEVLKRLEHAWVNERLAPEILQHKFDIVECMLTQLHHMERNLGKLPTGDLRIMLHQLEINRIRYVITNYVKTRLKKIETFAIYLTTEQRFERLTSDERDYLRNYMIHLEKLFNSTILNYFNTNSSSVDWHQMATPPNLDAHVFIRALEATSAIEVNDEQIIDLHAGDRYVVSYKYVKDIIPNDTVQLV